MNKGVDSCNLAYLWKVPNGAPIGAKMVIEKTYQGTFHCPGAFKRLPTTRPDLSFFLKLPPTRAEVGRKKQTKSSVPRLGGLVAA